MDIAAHLCVSSQSLGYLWGCRRQESREAAAIVMQVMRQDREDAIRNLGAVVLAQRLSSAVTLFFGNVKSHTLCQTALPGGRLVALAPCQHS